MLKYRKHQKGAKKRLKIWVFRKSCDLFIHKILMTCATKLKTGQKVGTESLKPAFKYT